MIPIKFHRALADKNGLFGRWEETDGFFAFDKFGYTWVVHSETNEDNGEGMFESWEITEVSTGFCIPFQEPALSADHAIERAIKFLDEKGRIMVNEKIRIAQDLVGSAPPPISVQPKAKPLGLGEDQPQ